MVKGVSIKFKSYEETILKLLEIIKFDNEIKKHDKIVLKPNLIEGDPDRGTKVEFVEEILKFIMKNKNPGTEIFIVEGCDGKNTMDVFDDLGYKTLAEKYDVGLIDLNKTETTEVESEEFLGFDSIMYPKILLESFVISLPKLLKNNGLIYGSLDSMVGAFPANYYSGFFSSDKNKLRKYGFKFQVHDILKCKMPNFSILDFSDEGLILAGKPLEMDKQGAKLLGIDWRNVPHLRLVDDSFSSGENEDS